MHSPRETLHVPPELDGSVLAAALKSLLPEISWSHIRRLVVSRRVQVNGNLCLDDARRMKQGDVISISEHTLAAPVTAADVRLVHVDPHVVVVDKPAQVTTLRHREEREWSDQRKQRQPTLDELVDQMLSGDGAAERKSHDRRRAKDTPARVRAVHRLDRDTSGLMVFARTPEAEVELIRQFKKHKVERAYLAIAHGQVAEQTIESYLVRDRGDELRGSTNNPNAEGTQRAVTHVRPLETLGEYTVVECRLETGRTHQIRIHLAERGHALCGEKMYVRQPGGTTLVDRSGATRQALHAAVLGFTHPITGARLQFVSPLPKDMVRLLERLRNAG
jgi:23S rRNA pseudouridine1911/1915/1917 synthase